MRISLVLNKFHSAYNSAFTSPQKAQYVDLSTPNDTFEYTSSPISFRAACSETNFQIKNIKNLRCPACAKIMLNESQMEYFAQNVSSKKGQDLVNAFDEFGSEAKYTGIEDNKDKTIYRPQNAQVIDIIKALALKHPTLSLSELVQGKAKECIGELIVQQMDVVRELEAYLKTVSLSEAEKDGLDYVIEIYKRQILGKNDERFKRQCFIRDLKNRVDDSEIQGEINKIISRLPNSANSIDSFFVKWGISQSSSKDIAYNLIYDARATAEHILPKSKGGKNDTNNYICDCAYCNTARSNMDFDEWVDTIPDFEENLQEYIETVAEYIDNETIDLTYLNYIDTIIKVLKRRSDDKINLRTPAVHSNSAHIQSQKKKEKALAHAKEVNLKIKAKMDEIKEHIACLEAYPYSFEVNYFESLKERYSRTETKLADANETLRNLNLRMHNISSLKRKITQQEVSLQKINRDAPYSTYDEKLAEINALKAQLSAMDENLLQLEIDSLKAKIEEYQDRLNTLQNDISDAHYASREYAISVLIDKLTPIIEKSNAILMQLAPLKSQAQKENRLRAELKQLQDKNTQLTAQNDEISQDIDITTITPEKYDEFIHLMSLLQEADDIKAQKRNRKNKELMELLDIASESIELRSTELADDPTVRYYTNLDAILDNKKQIDLIAKELAKIEATKGKISALEQELKDVNEGSTFEDNDAEYQGLISEREFMSEVRELPNLKKQYEDLKTSYMYNEKIISQLENSTKIGESRFYELVKLIYATALPS